MENDQGETKVSVLTRLAELFLLAALLCARDDNRGRNVRRTIYDHFTRFQYAPNPAPFPVRLRFFQYAPPQMKS